MRRKTSLFIERMCSKNLSLALAESMTCGLAAHQLSTTKGTADVLKGSIVCYTEEVKTGLMNVPRALIKKHTAESMQVTRALAKQLSKMLDADVYAAITGLASPKDEPDSPPVGTVFFCILYKKKLINERALFRGSPLEIRKKACMHLYELITKHILQKI